MNCCMLLSNAIPMQLSGGLFDLSMPWTNHRDSATYKLSLLYTQKYIMSCHIPLGHDMSYAICHTIINIE